MKRVGDYFIQIKHSVRVKYDGEHYKREETITNGRISYSWTWMERDGNGHWHEIEYVGDKKLLNKLNKAYKDMSYSEMFKK